MIQAAGRDIKITGRFIRTARVDAEKFRFIDEPEPVLEALRKSDERIDLFTFMQRLPASAPKHTYPMEWDNLAVLPIKSFEDWWNRQLGFKARNKAKQAEKKGVVLREVPFDDQLARGIWEIYNETPIRQGRRFPHYGKDPETVRCEAATFLDASFFIGAFFEDKLIGFAKLTCDETNTQAGLMHIIAMVQHRDKAPTNALIAHAVRACAERRIPHLVYSNFAYGKKERDSLAEFKERNGFQRMDVPRYYIPLTALGRLGLRFGWHRRIVERVPEPIMARLRALRASVYSRRFHLAKEAY